MVLGDGEGKDRETAVSDALEGLEGGENGVARRDDVVHEQDVFALQLLGADEREDTLHIFGSFLLPQSCLMTVVVGAEEVCGIHRNPRHATQTAGNEKRLVVAALAQATGVQGNGDNEVDILPETRFLPLACRCFCQKSSQLRSVGIFDESQESACILFMPVAEGGGQ